ncbi:hypothetical protein LTR16_010736, partial [Cryomyces antarcticus]
MFYAEQEYSETQRQYPEGNGVCLEQLVKRLQVEVKIAVKPGRDLDPCDDKEESNTTYAPGEKTSWEEANERAKL